MAKIHRVEQQRRNVPCSFLCVGGQRDLQFLALLRLFESKKLYQPTYPQEHGKIYCNADCRALPQILTWNKLFYFDFDFELMWAGRHNKGNWWGHHYTRRSCLRRSRLFLWNSGTTDDYRSHLLFGNLNINIRNQFLHKTHAHARSRNWHANFYMFTNTTCMW